MQTHSCGRGTESHFVYMLYIFSRLETSELLGCYKKLVWHTCQNCPGKHLSSQTVKKKKKGVFLVWGCDWMLPSCSFPPRFMLTYAFTLLHSQACTRGCYFSLRFWQMLNKHRWRNVIVMSCSQKKDMFEWTAHRVGRGRYYVAEVELINEKKAVPSDAPVCNELLI